MSQNMLIEKIKQEAAATVADIKSTGAIEVESIQLETKAAIVKLTEAHTIALNKKLAKIELVAVSRAKQEGKIAVQRAKREQIDTLFSEVRAEIENQSAEEYVAFFQKRAVEIMPKSVKVTSIQAPAARQSETKKILESLGLVGDLVADSAIEAGFIAHTNDGVYDITLDRLMNEKRAELEMEVINKVGA